jgi:hypothetical protein
MVRIQPEKSALIAKTNSAAENSENSNPPARAVKGSVKGFGLRARGFKGANT